MTTDVKLLSPVEDEGDIVKTSVRTYVRMWVRMYVRPFVPNKWSSTAVTPGWNQTKIGIIIPDYGGKAAMVTLTSFEVM